MTLDLADIRPSVYSSAIIVLTAIIGIVLLKWLNARYPLPLGIGDIINAV